MGSLDRNWLSSEDLCGMLHDSADGTVKMRLVTNPPVGSRELELADVLEQTFDAGRLSELHRRASEASDGDADWTMLVSALAIATERAQFPKRHLISNGRGGSHPYQVFFTGTTDPLEVTVVVPDGEDYRSTIVPPGSMFQITGVQIPDGADLMLVPVALVRATETKTQEDETP